MPSLAVQHTDAQLDLTEEIHARILAIDAVRNVIEALDIVRTGEIGSGHLWAARMVMRDALATLDAWDAAYDAAHAGEVD